MSNNTKLTTFYIVRHGETVFNKKGIMQGNIIDSPLTKRGENQAERVRKKLSKLHFDEIFSSDLFRAKRTAEIITLERKLAVKTTQALREQNYGRYEGKPYKVFHESLRKLLQKYERLDDRKKKHFRLESGIETDEEAVSRFITFIREIAIAYAGKNILVVSHGDVIKYFLIHVGFATYQQLSENAIENCSYIKVQSDGIVFFIKETNGIYMREAKDI